MTNREEEYDEDLPFEDEDDEMFQRRERERHGRQGSTGLGNFVRRAVEKTVGEVQNTGAIPKDAINYVLQQGDRGRKEVVRLVAKEVGDFLRHTDISSEVVKILTNVQVDMNASIRFKRNPNGRLATEVSEGSEVAVTGLGEPEEPFVEDEPSDEDPV